MSNEILNQDGRHKNPAEQSEVVSMGFTRFPSDGSDTEEPFVPSLDNVSVTISATEDFYDLLPETTRTLYSCWVDGVELGHCRTHYIIDDRGVPDEVRYHHPTGIVMIRREADLVTAQALEDCTHPGVQAYCKAVWEWING